MASILIIVDASQLGGISLEALSDYLAFVALTRPRLDAPAPSGSILGLFAADPVTRLTESDRSYLAALYAAPVDRSATAQASMIKNRMDRELQRPATAKPN